jgi:hypothetical protein
MLLRAPDLAGLPQYLDALRRGWTPESDQDLDAANKIIQRVEADPERFLAALLNPEGGGPPVQLAGGSLVPRLAHVRYWIWDDSYCGEVNLRWQPGTTELPPAAMATSATPSPHGSVAGAWPLRHCVNWLPSPGATGLPGSNFR